ncbi:hypothetical protein IWQ62_000188 [Dispira parvispora]|uniref:Ral GTPase-activating protein subunit alpha/beta N-terminal domain-containing protein n=1 Tax=Dispira parvispora TaxID=1520584 RepID=A0A9W8E9X4_9FUNG|nr:hypothetical protein IWQ62_000188 [Dispira parvispora]
MVNSQLRQLDFTPLPEESELLSTFPLATRRALVIDIIEALANPASVNALLPTTNHVRWVMTVLEQAFRLTSDDIPLMETVINMYQRWLLEPRLRPQVFRNESQHLEEQRLIQRIFLHFSMVFEFPSSDAVSRGADSREKVKLRSSTTSPRPSPSDPSARSSPQRHSGSNSSTHSLTRSPLHQGYQRRAWNMPLFTGSVGNRGVRSDYIELCKHVLQILATAGRTMGSHWSTKTWKVLLQVLLGVSDYLLSPGHSQSYRTLTVSNRSPASQPLIDQGSTDIITKVGESLSEYLFRVTLELWLRAGIIDDHIWDSLDRCYQNWTHHLSLVLEWGATALALTKRMLRHMYQGNPRVGSDRVHIAFKGYNVQLELTPEFTYYAWRRILYLVKDVEQLAPSCFNHTINGVAEIVDCLLSVGKPPDKITLATDLSPSIQHPSQATILGIVGPWLFSAARIQVRKEHFNTSIADSYAIGRAKAYSILISIFTIPQISATQACSDQDLLNFYNLIREGLEEDECIQAIILQGPALLNAQLKGIRRLVPNFIRALGQILPYTRKGFKLNPQMTLANLRYSACQVLGCLIALPHYFTRFDTAYVMQLLGQDVDLSRPVFPDTCPWNNPKERSEDTSLLEEAMCNNMSANLALGLVQEAFQEQIASIPQSLIDFKQRIMELLMVSLAFEKDSRNYDYMFRLILMFTLHDISNTPKLLKAACELVRVTCLNPKKSVAVTLGALNTLKWLASVLKYTDVSGEWRKGLVFSLCQILDDGTESDRVSWHSLELIIRTSECLQAWTLSDNWIANHHQCMARAYTVLKKLMDWKPKSVPPELTQEANVEGDAFAFNTIFYYSAPMEKGSEITFTLNMTSGIHHPSEHDVLKIKLSPWQFLQYVTEDALHQTIFHFTQMHGAKNKHSIPLGWSDLDNIRDHILTPVVQNTQDSTQSKPFGPELAYSSLAVGHSESAGNPDTDKPHDSMPVPHAKFFAIENFVVTLVQDEIHSSIPVPQILLPDQPNALGGSPVSQADNTSRALLSHSGSRSLGPDSYIVFRYPSGKIGWRMITAGTLPFIDRLFTDKEGVQHLTSTATSLTSRSPRATQDILWSREPFENRDHMEDNSSRLLSEGEKKRCIRVGFPLQLDLPKRAQPLLVSIQAWPIHPQSLMTPTCQGILHGLQRASPAAPPNRRAHPDFVRISLTQLGYCGLDANVSITPLKLSAGLLADMRMFDTLTDAPNISASILYAQNAHTAWSTILSPNAKMSRHFLRILDSLGKYTLVGDYQGFKGTLGRFPSTPVLFDRCGQSEILYYLPQLEYYYKEQTQTPSQASQRGGTQSDPHLNDIGREANENLGPHFMFDQAVQQNFSCIIWVEEPMMYSPRGFVMRLIQEHHRHSNIRYSKAKESPGGRRRPPPSEAPSKPLPQRTHKAGDNFRTPHESQSLPHLNRPNLTGTDGQPLSWLPMLLYLVLSPVPYSQGHLILVRAVIVNPDQTNSRMAGWVKNLERQFHYLLEGMVVERRRLVRFLRVIIATIYIAGCILKNGYRHMAIARRIILRNVRKKHGKEVGSQSE